MNITINGDPANITLEKERVLGEFLSGIDNWLSGSEHILSGLQVDGAVIGIDAMDDAFRWELEKIKTIAIQTSTRSELLMEALLSAQEILGAYGDVSFNEQDRIRADWEESPAGAFLSKEAPDLYAGMGNTLRGEGLPPPQLADLMDERLRELEDPQKELRHMEKLISGIARRLEDLPLDIQTGKDRQAAETISLFSGITEKLFRLLFLLKQRGILTEALTVEDLPFEAFTAEFTAVLKELLAAYEIKDTVLVGDLAEYELAPRLLKLYAVMRNPTEEQH
jgi:hypothetical protein